MKQMMEARKLTLIEKRHCGLVMKSSNLLNLAPSERDGLWNVRSPRRTASDAAMLKGFVECWRKESAKRREGKRIRVRRCL